MSDKDTPEPHPMDEADACWLYILGLPQMMEIRRIEAETGRSVKFTLTKKGE